ncbi:MAG: metallophosphoesterase, partial [Planctomycetota bacterium]
VSVIFMTALAAFAMTITSTIVMDSDDGTEVNQITWFEHGTQTFNNRLGHELGDDYLIGLRFGMDGFRSGDKVTYARLRFASRGSVLNGSLNLLIEGVLQASPTPFSSFERPSLKLPKTTVKIPWTIREPWEIGSNPIPLWYSSPDIAPIINQILGLPDWGFDPECKSIIITIKSIDDCPSETNYLQFRDFRYGTADLKCPVKLETFRTVYDTFLGKELLGKPTDRSVTVRVNSLIDTDVYAQYGTLPGLYTHKTELLPNQPAGKPVDIDIRHLQPDTRYYYRLQYRKASCGDFETGEEYSFQTQRSEGSGFVFAIQADEHLQGMHKLPENLNDQMLYKTTLQNVADSKPDFFISMGDFAHTEFVEGMGRNACTYEEAADRYLLQRKYIDSIGHSIPFYLVLGNHEGEQGWGNYGEAESYGDLPRISVAARKALIPNPSPNHFYSGNQQVTSDAGWLENYYAWHWGDALFVVLDPFSYTKYKPYGSKDAQAWNWTLGREQYEWLHETLHDSRAKWKFIFIHQLVSSVTGNYGKGGIEAAKFKVDNRPSYEWGGEDDIGASVFDEKRPGWSHGAIHDMLVEENVTIVFHGHDHFFGKQELDGIVYLECPQPGDSDYSMGYKYQGKYTYGDFIENSGFIQVNVNPHTVLVDYIRSFLPGDGVNGKIAYSLAITDLDRPEPAHQCQFHRRCKTSIK